MPTGKAPACAPLWVPYADASQPQAHVPVALSRESSKASAQPPPRSPQPGQQSRPETRPWSRCSATSAAPAGGGAPAAAPPRGRAKGGNWRMRRDSSRTACGEPREESYHPTDLTAVDFLARRLVRQEREVEKIRMQKHMKERRDCVYLFIIPTAAEWTREREGGGGVARVLLYLRQSHARRPGRG